MGRCSQLGTLIWGDQMSTKEKGTGAMADRAVGTNSDMVGRVRGAAIYPQGPIPWRGEDGRRWYLGVTALVEVDSMRS